MVLESNPDDDLQTIRKRYLKLSKEHHPDLLLSKGVPEEVIEEIQPLSKRGEGSDIAGMAVFLAGDDSLFVTGQEHIVDGGLLASGPRMIGRLHNSRNLHRMAGMAYGSSGQVPTFRRL